MTDWVPSWLAKQYNLILTHCWTQLFTVSEAEKIVTGKPRIVLSRLAKHGWLERVGRGAYRAVHPLAIFSDLRFGWRTRVRQKEYLSMLEFVLGRLWEGFGERLRAVVLFGSLARGQARENSDVDLLVVADDMPDRYGDRVRDVLNMIEGWESVKRLLSEKHGVHPSLDLILLDTREVETSHPFYFDIVHEGVVLYDKDEFMVKKLGDLMRRLELAGAQRIQLPGGKWYWLVPQTVEGLSIGS